MSTFSIAPDGRAHGHLTLSEHHKVHVRSLRHEAKSQMYYNNACPFEQNRGYTNGQLGTTTL